MIEIGHAGPQDYWLIPLLLARTDCPADYGAEDQEDAQLWRDFDKDGYPARVSPDALAALLQQLDPVFRTKQPKRKLDPGALWITIHRSASAHTVTVPSVAASCSILRSVRDVVATEPRAAAWFAEWQDGFSGYIVAKDVPECVWLTAR